MCVYNYMSTKKIWTGTNAVINMFTLGVGWEADVGAGEE